MGKTLIFPVNSVGDPEPITAQTTCQQIEIMEDQSVIGWPTVDYQIHMPGPGNDALSLRKGQRYIITATGSWGNEFFHPGDIVAYINTVSGSSDFTLDETTYLAVTESISLMR